MPAPVAGLLPRVAAVLVALLFALPPALAPAPLSAADLPAPTGAVVVTIAGKIANTNRGPFDAEKDLFLKYHERSFDKAAAFDYAMLDGLGTHAVEVTVPGLSAPVYVEGPYLRDLVAAVGGAEGSAITLLALDGYGSEISWADLQALDWIVGIREDGKPLALGQRGPLWVVYTYPDGRALTADDEARWPWATFYIEIH